MRCATLNPLGQLPHDTFLAVAAVDQENASIIIFITDGPADELVHSSHAQILVIFAPSRRLGAPLRPAVGLALQGLLIEPFHPFSELRIGRRWKRQPNHHHTPGQLVREIDAFRHFCPNHTKKHGTSASRLATSATDSLQGCSGSFSLHGWSGFCGRTPTRDGVSGQNRVDILGSTRFPEDLFSSPHLQINRTCP